jgi:endonuclease/exonuclease/phosphatase family metal-dependent hydrolase
MALLRCLSFNIWKNEGDYPRRMAAIGALLREQKADVVALQECFVAPALGIDSAQALAGREYHVTRYRARAKKRWHDGAWQESRSDMAILSRAMPSASGMVALPEDGRDGERGLLWIDLPIAGGHVCVGCTHLTHLRDDAAQQIRKTQAIAAIAALLSTDGPAILMGDLNAESHHPSLEPIFGHPNLCRKAHVLALTSAGEAPANGAIDHALPFSDDGAIRMLRRRVLAPPDPANLSISPSDHPAILAEIELS